MPPRNSRNTTSPLLTHVTVGLHSPTAEATLHLKRIYHPRRSQLPPLSRASLASSSLLTPLLCFSPTFPGRRCAPLHDLPSSPFMFCSASLLLCCTAALLRRNSSSLLLFYSVSLLLFCCLLTAIVVFFCDLCITLSTTFSSKIVLLPATA